MTQQDPAAFLDCLPYYRLGVRLRAGAAAVLKKFPAPALYGALRDGAAAIAHERFGACPKDCGSCKARPECPAAAAFEPLPSQDKPLPYKVKTSPPKPYAIKCRPLRNACVEAGQDLAFELILAGPAASNLPFVYAALGAGRGEVPMTLGPRGEEAPFTLEAITCRHSGRAVFGDGVVVGEPEAATAWAPGRVGRALEVRFVTPFVPAGKAPPASFADFLVELDRRLRSLVAVWGEKSDDVGDKLDKVGAERVVTMAARVAARHENLRHGGARGPTTVRGYLGTLVFEGDWRRWARLVVAAEAFNIGKHAVKGFGWYEFNGR